MAEAADEVVEPVVEPVVEKPPVSPPVETPDDDDLTREPGGDSPEETYARRRARELRQAREDREQLRLDKARLEGELEALRKSRVETEKPAQKIFTIAEVNAAVEAGQISRIEGDRYIDEVIIPKRIDDRLQVREIAQRSQEPLKRAHDEVTEYTNYVPGLKDKTTPEFRKAADKYAELVRLGYPNDIRTERVAVEMAHGDLAGLRRKHEIASRNAEARTIPVDAGGSPSSPSAKIDINKAPQTMKDDWDRDGVDKETRQRRYEIYLDLKAKQGARGR